MYPALAAAALAAQAALTVSGHANAGVLASTLALVFAAAGYRKTRAVARVAATDAASTA